MPEIGSAPVLAQGSDARSFHLIVYDSSQPPTQRLRRVPFGDLLAALQVPSPGQQLVVAANWAAMRSLLQLGTAAQAAVSDFEPAGSIAVLEGEINAALAGKAASSHTHPQSEITGLDAALTAKADASHLHDARYLRTVNSVGPDGSGNVVVTAPDPWTTVRLTSDFTTSSATAVDATGLAFAPTANKRYEFYGLLLCRTATATVGPRPGLAWPTGLSDGAASIRTPSSATAELLLNGNPNAAMLAAVGGLPNNTQSYLASLEGLIVAGASPAGNMRIQLASETAGTVVTIKAGSFLRYREIV